MISQATVKEAEILLHPNSMVFLYSFDYLSNNTPWNVPVDYGKKCPIQMINQPICTDFIVGGDLYEWSSSYKIIYKLLDETNNNNDFIILHSWKESELMTHFYTKIFTN